MDGFVRHSAQGNPAKLDVDHSGSSSYGARQLENSRTIGTSSVRPEINSANEATKPRENGIKSAIDESLKDIDGDTRTDEAKERRKIKRKKIIKRVIIGLLLIMVLIGSYIGVKALLASGSIFKGNILGLVQQKPLKQDANGRTNIVILGTSGSVDDENHPGALLTDSIMMLSVNQTKKDAFMVSIPRDLWIKTGAACQAGYEAKINSLYECYSKGGKDQAAGATALQNKVGQILGLEAQYYVHVNWQVLQGAVDSVGGVDVKIESDDPRGILDRNFDWVCQYKCYMVRYKNGEVAHLDGAHALALARARNEAGGYGLGGGNFDREKNQQKILVALREKAMSAGTLTDVGKVTGLIDTFGENLRSNFDTSEIRTLMAIAKDTSADKIVSISLVDEKEPVVTTGDYSGQSIVRPVKGVYDYSGIGAYVNKKMNNSGVANENAQVDIYNGSGVAGAAQAESNRLEAKGFTVGGIGNAPAGNYTKAVVYQVGEGNSKTKAALEKLYGVKVKTEEPPVPITGETKFVVIIAKATESTQSTSGSSTGSAY